MPDLIALTAGDTPEIWRSLGFAVEGARCRLGSVEIVLDPSVGKGIRRWTLRGGPPAPETVEGLPTEWVARSAQPPFFGRSAAPGAVERPKNAGEAAGHPNGVTAIDHLVLLSPDVDRTLVTLTELGFEMRRERLTDTYGAPMRQVFFWAGDVILELVGAPTKTGDGHARVFGLALTSRDLDTTASFLGDRLHASKDAVQHGRRIATLDKSAGSTVALAFMSPPDSRAQEATDG